MFDRSILEDMLVKYKQDFVDEIWPEEKYKWEAVKHFQDNWDVGAVDFAEMLKRSLAKTGNLLTSVNTFPRKMIQEFAEGDPEYVRAMFLALFDENVDLFERISVFKDTAEEPLEKLKRDSVRSHYQTENTISTYLWLRYPDKYYIYKWSEARNLAKKLNADYRFKRGDYANNVRDHLALYDEICEELRADSDLQALLRSHLTPDCYPDPELKTLTIDISFYISRYESDQEVEETKAWWPSLEEYDPGLSVEDWERLLQDDQVFTTKSLEVMKRLKDSGGVSTCRALASKYGQTFNFYNSVSSALARRVASESGCPINDGNKGKVKWWPILYTGRYAGKEEEGHYVWRLRDELSEALDHIDLSATDLFHNEILEDHDVGYWWLIANPKQFSFSDLAVGDVETWSLQTDNSGKRARYQNFLDAKTGDLVVGYESQPVKQIVALGKIAAEQDGEYLRFEKSEGLITPIDYQTVKNCSELIGMEAFTTNMRGSLFKLTKEEYEAALDLIRKENPEISEGTVEFYTKDDFLSEVYMTKEDYDRLVGVVRNKKNMILQGAPGVGKTFAANRLAWSMMQEKDASRIEFVQFHQNYSYEDFMMGYKPDGDGFKLKDGIFYQFCKKAANHPEKEYFFIIDEINRGNMSKIFGELLMLIERDYRGSKVTLAYNGNLFSVPDNVHIIGMMNTADRSLAMIDYALRRRFSFVEMKPGFDTEGFKKYQESLGNETFDQLILSVQSLNAEITKDSSLGKGFCIGHSYFCGQTEITEDWLRAVVDYDILPMLEEYWFDDEKKLQKWHSQLHGVLQQ